MSEQNVHEEVLSLFEQLRRCGMEILSLPLMDEEISEGTLLQLESLQEEQDQLRLRIEQLRASKPRISLSDSARNVAEEYRRIEEQIHSRLTSIRDGLQNQIERISQSRRARNMYNYESSSDIGYFVDSRR
ncbi:hypothetical protein [Paenibacillus kobensis]|uniref:hypothetical protein n=1 Tax=Paenibacillus kobensis TaxID=59841 RepID=UPI000FD82219|nr:hypothetical protein [Paenibacillus kobensis]